MNPILKLFFSPELPLNFFKCVLLCVCSGTIGSENTDNIDNRDEDFYPLTLKRNIMPPYTPTARWDTPSPHTPTVQYIHFGSQELDFFSMTFILHLKYFGNLWSTFW